ncbi:hypothetical protein MRX96_056051 [Rhipicephalus microplus]
MPTSKEYEKKTKKTEAEARLFLFWQCGSTRLLGSRAGTAEGVHAQTAQQWPPKLRQTTECDALRTAAQGPLYEEVLGKSPSNRSAAAYRKNDEEELFDFIKDYLFNRGGAQKLNSRSGNGRAQFVGVDSGGANGSAASGGADKDSGESAQRYKMHIIKFRLVNASHPAVTVTRNAQVCIQ